METAHAALATIAEIGLLTYTATGTEGTLPDEVFDAPVVERALVRNFNRLKFNRGSPEELKKLVRLAQEGPASAIEAEIQRLKGLLTAGIAKSYRLRLVHQVDFLNTAMAKSFEKFQQEQEGERDRGGASR